MRRILFFTGLLAFALFPAFAAAQERTCPDRIRELGPTALRMPYYEFDQSPEGWRKVVDCPKEAQLLLDRYVKKQEDELRRTRWHLGQMIAMNGDNARAAEVMALAINPPELESAGKFSWNTYAFATIAFLKNDRTAFDTHFNEHRRRTSLAEENRNNLGVLERLSRCFGKSYAVAYACEA